MTHRTGTSPRYGILVLAASLSACSITGHGTFVPHSYIPEGQTAPGKSLGKVSGKSCQTSMLYLFPKGAGADTDSAIDHARSQQPGTDYLVDISIDKTSYIGVGYSIDCVRVVAEAYSLGEN